MLSDLPLSLRSFQRKVVWKRAESKMAQSRQVEAAKAQAETQANDAEEEARNGR